MLYDMTMKEAAQSAIDEIMTRLDVSKARATELFKNAIIYNCVIDEIVGQADFLLEKANEDERKKAIEQVVRYAVQVSRTGDWTDWRKAEELAIKYGIEIQVNDNSICIEDDVIYLENN